MYGTCLKCDAANHFPIHYEVASGTPFPYEYECIDQGHNNLDDLGFNQVYFDFTTNSIEMIDSGLPENIIISGGNTATEYNTLIGVNYKDHCLKIRTPAFQDCKENSQYGFKCGVCNDGFALVEDSTSHNKCLALVDFCLKYIPGTSICKLCKPEYKLDLTNNLCETRNVTPNEYNFDTTCLGNATSTLGCDYCPQGNTSIERKYMDSNGVNTDCLESDPATGFCIQCDAGTDFTASTATCTANTTTPNPCHIMNPSPTATSLGSSDCLVCNDGYIYDSNDDCVAIDNSVINFYQGDLTVPTYTACGPEAYLVTSATTKDKFECTIMNPDVITTPDPNCLVYLPDGNCALCVQGSEGDWGPCYAM